MCLSDPVDPASLYPVSFLCPNGTLFSQQVFVCDWWFNVDCGAAADQYGAVAGAFGGAGALGECPAPTRTVCEGAVSNCWSPGQRDTGKQSRHSLRYSNRLSFQIVPTTVCAASTGVRIPVWTARPPSLPAQPPGPTRFRTPAG